MRFERWFLGSVLPLVLFALPTSASTDTQERGTLTGEVVQVRQSVRTENEGALDEIRVRTQQGEESWVRLGLADPSGQQWQVGDKVRARFVGLAKDGQAVNAVKVHNYRTGRTERIRSGDGTQLRLQTRERLQDGSGNGTQTRERANEQGTGSSDRSRGRGGRG